VLREAAPAEGGCENLTLTNQSNMNHTLDRVDLDVATLLRPEILERIRWLRGLWIEGIEVTQAIQYQRSAEHLSDSADQAPDNSVPLIAGKPAWVRVYVRSGFWVSEIPNVAGTLEVIRRQDGALYLGPGTTFMPQPPGSVTASQNPDYATERGTLGYTLNFIIPAEQMCGSLRLTARVSAPGGHSAERTIYVNATLRQTLRLAGIMVGYNGPTSMAPGAPNLTLAAPTVANMQTTSAWTLLTFPVQSAATYRSAGTITWNLPLTDAPSCSGCCTPNWVALNTAVQAQRVADGNRTDVLYYGLMAVGIPMGPIIGCNSGGVSTGSNGDAVTMAHELGHACGLPHAPCGTPGDPTYPAYEPYDPAGTPQASIGEYGLDISNGNIFSPAMFKDMMAYCGPRWISLHNTGRLTNNANLAPGRSCVDYPWWRDLVLQERVLIPERWLPDPPPDPIWRNRVVNPEPLISIIGVVHSDTEIEIKSLMRLDAVRDVQGGSAMDLSAELIGEKGKVVAHAPVYRLQSHGAAGCHCGSAGSEAARYPYLFQAFVTNAEPGAALRIRHGEKEIWSRIAPQAPPRVASFKASLKSGTQLSVEWGVEPVGESETECWLQWSKDRGKTWNGLATGLRGKKAFVDASGVSSGRVLLRLLASNGFHTAESKGVTVQVPKRAPAVSILSPRDGQTLVVGNPIRLWGAATNDQGGPVSDARAQWVLDGNVAGKGFDVFTTAPPAGEHRLTLVVTSDGKRTEQHVKFKTVRIHSEDTESAEG